MRGEVVGCEGGQGVWRSPHTTTPMAHSLYCWQQQTAGPQGACGLRRCTLPSGMQLQPASGAASSGKEWNQACPTLSHRAVLCSSQDLHTIGGKSHTMEPDAFSAPCRHFRRQYCSSFGVQGRCIFHTSLIAYPCSLGWVGQRIGSIGANSVGSLGLKHTKKSTHLQKPKPAPMIVS